MQAVGNSILEMTANSVCSGWRFNIAIWWCVWLNRIDAICYAMLVLPGVLNILPHNGLSSLFGIEFESILLFVYLNPLFDRKFINLRLTWSFITFHLNCPLKWLMRRTSFFNSYYYHDVLIKKLISMALGVYQHLLTIWHGLLTLQKCEHPVS